MQSQAAYWPEGLLKLLGCVNDPFGMLFLLPERPPRFEKAVMIHRLYLQEESP